MTARVGFVLSALLLGVGVFAGLQYSGATFLDESQTSAQVTAAPDWVGPDVALVDPGFLVFGTVEIAATATDPAGVASVEIQHSLGGSWVTLCVDAVAPFSCTWDTTTVVDGSYELRATATDDLGYSATSAPIATEVANSASVVLDPISSPSGGVVTLTAHLVNAGNGSRSIEFEYVLTGGTNWQPVPGCVRGTTSEHTCEFNTTGLNATYDVRAVGKRGGRTFLDVQDGVVLDNTAPTVTVDQAVGQTDPASGATVNFTVVFSEAVTGFQTGDAAIGGTTGGTKVGTVTGSGATYTVAVTGMTGDGTLTVTIPAGVASDAAANSSQASSSTDNTVVYDGSLPTVSVEQAVTQVDPTNGATISFSVVFSEIVTGFATGDVLVTGTAGGTKIATVSGSGTTYTVAVTGMSTSGTIVASLPGGVATDVSGNGNATSTSLDNVVTYDVTAPTLTINQAVGQSDPTNSGTINFTVVFSEPVADFATGDVTISGTAPGTKTGTVSGSGTTYNVAVTGMTGTSGTVIASVAAGRATDSLGNASTASTSTDNTVTRDLVRPSVTINQASGQADPTTGSSISYTVVFSEAVTGFDGTDVTVSGTTTGNRVATVTGSGATYTVAVSGMIGDGTVIATVAAGRAADAAGNTNTVSTRTDNTVTYNDTIAPTVTINQTATQPDPTNGATINFTVVFSETVTGFVGTDVTISGTTTGTKTRTVTGSGTTYNVAVTGMTSGGTVIATIAAGVATDTGANTNVASTSTDNTVTRDVTAPTATINRAAGQADPGSGTQVNFTVTFSEAVTGFDNTDVAASGTAGGTRTVTVSGTGTTYNVRVTGMTTAGTVVMNVAAGRATDAAGNGNATPTIIDNSVIWAP